MKDIDAALSTVPIVAILRGVQPDEVLDIAMTLYARGVRCIEVPLNSPDPFASIERLAKELPEDCISGAGTVLSVSDAMRVRDAGGQIIVTPNTEPEVITASVEAGLIVAPGVGSASEAFAAVKAGATHLKLFPASSYGTAHIKALLSVLPKDTRMLAVGGVGAANASEWRAAGAMALGIGSDIYRAGDTAEDVAAKAEAICTALGC